MGSPVIRTLFIGGGTPSSIPSPDLSDFLCKLLAITGNISLESTIEVNPETVTIELLSVLSKNGINRISVGIQSLDNSILTTLGRNTDVETTLEALNIIKNYWTGSFSADLINTVPGQSVPGALLDISRIINFNPEHISLYNLTFEPSTKLYNLLKSGKLEPIGESEDSLMQIKSLELLESNNFKRYEISNFAKKGKESLHNLNYWNMGSYLGVGPSAASTLMTSQGPVRIEYKRSLSDFLQNSAIENRVVIENIKPESFLLEHLMMGFRLKKGIDILHINNIFKMNIEVYLKPLYQQWGKLLKTGKGSIHLTKEGLSLLNPFLIDIAALINKNNLHINAKEINWPILTAHF